MHKRQVLFSLILVALLTLLVSSVAFGKGHVALGNVQVCHNGIATEVEKRDWKRHLRHGDIQLPACDGTTVFGNGAVCSGAVDLTGPGNSGPDGKMDLASPNPVTSPACRNSDF